MEGFDKKEELGNEEMDHNGGHGVFSRVLRAGNRTYFFDVKTTRSDEYYLTITESKKRFRRDGHFFYEKHKVFVYREDLDDFVGALYDSVDFIRDERIVSDDGSFQETGAESDNQPLETTEPDLTVEGEQDEKKIDEQVVVKDYTEVEFDDLDT